MTKQQRAALEGLLREHIKLQADNLMLKRILSREHETGKAMKDWRAAFGQLQQSEQYLRMMAQGETDIQEALAAADRNEVIAGFLKNPPDGPAN